MKTITTLFCLIAVQCTSFCQTVADVTAGNGKQVCGINYSESSLTLVHNKPSKIDCREIAILSLPPQTQSLTVLNVDFAATGSYTLVKDEALELYEGKDIYVEDMLTGRLFDLKSNDSFSFNINRKVPDRFVLHIDNMLFRYSVSSN